jgi:hypothetical protein
MNFLKNLFGGGRSGRGDDRAIFLYVRPKRCNQIVQVRVDLYNELSQDDGGGYFIRKVVQAVRCPFPAELHAHFDNNRRLIETIVEDGEVVSEAEYENWQAEQEASQV